MINDRSRNPLAGDVPAHLRRLLEINKKSDLEKFSKTVVITQNDFVSLICNCGKIGYSHQIKYHDFWPSHLVPTEDEREAMSSVTVGETLAGDALKFITKITEGLEERRYLVAHVFFNAEKWHLFYFDQKDFGHLRKQHWKEGTHIHFVNYLWPQYSIERLWEVFNARDASVGGKLHIRYEYPPEGESGST